jgi:putative tricarboxylic transport membrane protein
MELFTIGFPVALTQQNLLFCFLGVFLGTLVGVLPGIGALAAISLLLPITYYIHPIPAIMMLAGIYYGAEYGGSTASILLRLPGTASSAITCIDGYPMTQQGKAGVALFTTTIASFIGGSIGILVLMFMVPVILALTLEFGPAQYFAAMLFGLVASATIGQGDPLKSVAMVVLGLILGIIGADVQTGTVRYTFGIVSLYDGISLVTLAMGLFGVSELIASVVPSAVTAVKQRISFRSMLPSKDEARRSVMPTLRGTALGTLFGPLPGTGPILASFLAYAFEKRISRTPERFGKGAIEGVAAPEAANNATVQTAFVPTLTLAIPGTPTMAIILGALMIHGIVPGPKMIESHPDLFWGLVASFWIGNVMLVILNIPLIGIWVRLLQMPYRFLYPTVICLICLGTYSLNNNIFDIGMLLLFGFIGYGMRLLNFEPAPLLIGFVLGPMMEQYFRRAMLIGRGDFMSLFDGPIATGLLVMSALLAVWVVSTIFRRRPPPAPAAPAASASE